MGIKNVIITLGEKGLFYSNGKKKIDVKAFKVLEKHSWPGNVRELENFFKKISLRL